MHLKGGVYAFCGLLQAIFLAAVVLVLAYPLRPQRRITKWKLWEHFHRYFTTRAVGAGVTAPPPEKPLLYCISPHGIFPFGIALSSLGE